MTNTKPTESKGGGRPSKYKPKFCEEMIKHFSIDPYKKETMESSTEYFANGAIKKKNEKFKLVPNKLPTFFNFARSIDVSHEALHRWRDARIGKFEKDETDTGKDDRPFKYPEFRVAYNAVKQLQKEFLMELGLAGASPPASFIFVAKNITDMRDKIEVPTDDQGNPVTGFIVLPQRMSAKDAEKEHTESGGNKINFLEPKNETKPKTN